MTIVSPSSCALGSGALPSRDLDLGAGAGDDQLRNADPGGGGIGLLDELVLHLGHRPRVLLEIHHVDGGVDDVSMDDSSLCDTQPTSAKSSLPNKKRAYGSMDTKRISGASEPRLSGGELV